MRNALYIIGLLAVAALVGADVSGSAGGGAVAEGASRKDVLAALGAPTLKRGAIRNDQGQLVEVWEYWGGESAEARCWYYFVGDELVASRQATDWASESERLKEEGFRAA